MDSSQTTSHFSDKYKLGSPFDLDNEAAYHAWLENKMDDYPQDISDIIVEVNDPRSEEHTSELQSPDHPVCRLLLENKNICG